MDRGLAYFAAASFNQSVSLSYYTVKNAQIQWEYIGKM